jgi:hypothetical protein
MDLISVKLELVKFAQDNYLTQTYPEYAPHITFCVYALCVVAGLYLVYQLIKAI